MLADAWLFETLALKSGDEEKLKAVLGDAGFYERFGGEKSCGGFHPDYAIVWSVEGNQYLCLMCFGCGEFRLYGPAGESYYDIAGEAQERLKILLASYRRNRPPHASFGP
jgi:hypothetical protein